MTLKDVILKNLRNVLEADRKQIEQNLAKFEERVSKIEKMDEVEVEKLLEGQDQVARYFAIELSNPRPEAIPVEGPVTEDGTSPEAPTEVVSA